MRNNRFNPNLAIEKISSEEASPSKLLHKIFPRLSRESVSIAKLGLKNFSLIHRQLRTVPLIIVFIFCSHPVNAQPWKKTGDPDQRIKVLEEELQNLRLNLTEYSNRLQSGLEEYTRNLEQSLSDFSRQLDESLQDRIKDLNYEVAYLQPGSTAYQRINTNTGAFLIALEKVISIEGGFRLFLDIGNPNYATYNGFKLKIWWGRRLEPDQKQSYDIWRSKLKGAEYSFEGSLKPGASTSIEMDVQAESREDLGHLECELRVMSIELGKP